MGRHGAEAIAQETAERRGQRKSINILTHCNTGSLATAGFGTALGVVRSLQAEGQLGHVYCTETRPYNQGAEKLCTNRTPLESCSHGTKQSLKEEPI